MGKYKFEHANQEGLVNLTFDQLDEATAFAKAMYRWGMPNCNGQSERRPILRDGRYLLRVSQEEFERIKSYNEEPIPEPEKKFIVFNPLIVDAAENVRVNFMSTPYKGATDETLDKKDYDGWQTVEFYTPPDEVFIDDTCYYRTEVATHKDNLISFLKKERKADKAATEVYEVLLEVNPLIKDASAGYELSVLKVDNIDVENNAEVLKWNSKAAAGTDPRFLLLECKGKYYIYGKNSRTEKYSCLEMEEGEFGLDALGIDIAPYAKKLFRSVANPSRLSIADRKSEATKSLIRCGKYAFYHPKDNSISEDDCIEAELKFTNIMDEVDPYKYTTISKKNAYLFDTEEEAEKFKSEVYSKLTGQEKEYYELNIQKQYFIPIDEAEFSLIHERFPHDFVVRPNHGFTHSMRTALYVPSLIQHYKKFHPVKCNDMDELDVRLLQIAMLFSVVGRQTEIGFASDAKINSILQKYTGKIEEIAKKMNALPAGAEKENLAREKANIISLQEAAFEKANRETTEYLKYRKDSAIAFLNYCNKSGFSEKYCQEKGETSSFLIDEIESKIMKRHLKQLVKDFPQNQLKDIGVTFTKNPKHLEDREDLKDVDLTEMVLIEMPMMLRKALELYKMSDPFYANFGDGFSTIIKRAHSLDLVRCYPKMPSESGSFHIGTIIGTLDIDGSADCRKSALNIVKSAIQALDVTGNRIMVNVDNTGEIIDLQKPTDFSKSFPASSDTNKCIESLAKVEMPLINELAQALKLKDLDETVEYNKLAQEQALKLKDLTETLKYEEAIVQSEIPFLKIDKLIPDIHSCSRNASDKNKVDLKFASEKEALLFLELMIQERFLEERALMDYANGNNVVVPKKAFDNMQGFVNYKLVDVIEKHNEEDNLINKKGEFSALKLIKDCEALGRHIDYNELKFNFDQMQDPIHIRPVPRLKGHDAKQMGLDRLKFIDLSNKSLDFKIKDFSLDIQKIPSHIKSDEEWGNFWDKKKMEWKKQNVRNRKKILIYPEVRVDPNDSTKSETHWWYYGRTAAGNYISSELMYVGDKNKLEDEKDEILKRLVIRFGFCKQYGRGIKDYQEVKKQMPVDQQGKSLKRYEDDDDLESDNLLPVSKFIDRGKPTNSIFTPKLATSLLRPDGKTLLFDRVDWPKYIPIGVLYDINNVHLKGERYIWQSNAISDLRLWFGKMAQVATIGTVNRNVSLNELQKDLKTQADNNSESTFWNELLVGLTKGAIKGLFIQNPSPAYRLTMVLTYMKLRTNYGIDVPLLIVDGKNEPRMYLEKDLKEDLTLLFELREKNAPDKFAELHNPDKSKEAQDKLLNELLLEIGYFGLKSKYSSVEKQVQGALNNINFIGGIAREREYLNKHWSDNDPEIQKQCLERVAALHHQDLISEIKHKVMDPVFDEIREKTITTQMERKRKRANMSKQTAPKTAAKAATKPRIKKFFNESLPEPAFEERPTKKTPRPSQAKGKTVPLNLSKRKKPKHK